MNDKIETKSEIMIQLKEWFRYEHLDVLLRQITALPEEQLLSAILEIRSDKPTKIGRVLINLPIIQEKIIGIMKGNDFIKWALEHDYNWDYVGVIKRFFNDQACLQLGMRFQATPFWNRYSSIIKKQQRSLKRIDSIMVS